MNLRLFSAALLMPLALSLNACKSNSMTQRTVLSERSSVSIGLGDYEKIEDKYASGFVIDRDSGRAVMDPTNMRRSPLLSQANIANRDFRTGRGSDDFIPGFERAPDRDRKFLGPLDELNPRRVIPGLRKDAEEQDNAFSSVIRDKRAVGKPFPTMEWLGENNEVKTSTSRAEGRGFHLFGEGVSVEETREPTLDATVSDTFVRSQDRRAHRKRGMDLSVDQVRQLLSPETE